MNNYLFVYFVPPNRIGNQMISAANKQDALIDFKKDNKESLIINIIRL